MRKQRVVRESKHKGRERVKTQSGHRTRREEMASLSNHKSISSRYHDKRRWDFERCTQELDILHGLQTFTDSSRLQQQALDRKEHPQVRRVRCKRPGGKPSRHNLGGWLSRPP